MTAAPSKPAEQRSRQTEIVIEYYRRVDAGDTSGVLELFDPDALYERPGYEAFRGRGDLERFYLHDRVIGSGTHEITSVIRDESLVAVEGTFNGVLRDGSQKSIGFADFFTVNDAIERRRSYFYVESI